MSGQDVTLEEWLARSAQQQTADAVTTMRNLFNQIDGDVQAVRGRWTGRAAGAFQSAATRWSENADEFRTRLDTLQQLVGDGNAIKGSVEDDNESMFLSGTDSGLTSYTNLPGDSSPSSMV
ncbi:MAG: WXG100 family type VII secretion target [Mycobacteriaceae bacterium]|nr:WXG100 family type VII secretion target [Mycobacteriaceae bacterium]